MQTTPNSKKPTSSFVPQDKSLPLKIGLALSGGATRGIAHIGVLKAFHENDVKIDMISGTSIGAFVAAFYAFSVSIEEMHRQAEKMSWLRISSLAISKSGFLSNRIIGDIVEEYIGEVTIEDSPIPLAIIATDIATGEKIVLRRGKLSQAVMASTCIPGIYTPIKFDGRLLVDGFITENLPLKPLREMGADVLIGVNLSCRRRYREPEGIINIILNAFEIAIDTGTIAEQDEADVLIEPELLNIADSVEEESKTLFERGYTEAINALPLIQKVVKKERRRRASLWGKFKSLFHFTT